MTVGVTIPAEGLGSDTQIVLKKNEVVGPIVRSGNVTTTMMIMMMRMMLMDSA